MLSCPKYHNMVFCLTPRVDTYKWAAMRDDRSLWEFPQAIAASRLIASTQPGQKFHLAFVPDLAAENCGPKQKASPCRIMARLTQNWMALLRPLGDRRHRQRTTECGSLPEVRGA